MNQAMKIKQVAETLGGLSELLEGVDLSSLKVVERISREVQEIKDDFNKEMKDHQLFGEYDIDIRLDSRECFYEAFEKIDDPIEHIFKEAIDIAGQYGLDFYTAEDVVDQVVDIRRSYQKARREIRSLEKLVE